MVMDGIYGNEGQVADPDNIGAVVTMTNSGAPGAPITIMAQNRGKAILDASSTVQSSMGCYGAWSYFDLSYVSYVVIQGFVLQNSCIHGIRVNGTAHDLTIRWNVMLDIGNWDNTAGTGNTTGIPGGIYTNSNEYNITIDGNTFINIGGGANVNQQHALYMSASNLTIVNNTFYNNFHGWDIQLAGARNVIIANNTFAFQNPNRAGQIILWDDNIANSLQNILIENNIFAWPQTYAIVTELDAGGSIGACTIANNLTTVSAVYDNGSSCSQWNNLTNTDPGFVNKTLWPFDFHVVAGSPAIDTGLNNYYTSVDHDGWARPLNGIFDIGAYEFHY